jgi:GT2 family glycosyltransferase
LSSAEPVTERRTAEISVAIATRHRPDLLARVLDALTSSDPLPREIVIADQSTDDATERVARARTGGAVMIRYLRDEGSGLGVAQNRAFSCTRCPIVAVTDDDCVPAPGWLAGIEKLLEVHPELGGVTGPVLPLDADDPDLVPVSSRTSAVPRTFSGKHVPWEVGSGNNFAARRNWLEVVGGNDERLGPGSPGRGGVDMDLFYRLLRADASIRYEPTCVVFHSRATQQERLARRGPYGYGVGANVAIWLREGDLYACWVLAKWLALRLRRTVTGVLARDWTLAHEEVLVLAGTAGGLLFGIRAGKQRPSSFLLAAAGPEHERELLA